jgi:hypothetical protein
MSVEWSSRDIPSAERTKLAFESRQGPTCNDDWDGRVAVWL